MTFCTIASVLGLAALVAGLAPQTNAAEPPNSPAVFTYQNPMPVGVINGMRDPFILQVDGVYYLTGTGKPFFELNYKAMGPPAGVPLYSSPDLKTWKFEGTLIPRKEGTWYRDRFWAPEIHVKQTPTGRKFYCTYNCYNSDLKNAQQIGLAVADDIRGPYKNLTPDAAMTPGNDADIFTDDDGKDYLFRAGVTAAEVDLEHAKVIGPWFDVVPKGAPTDWDTGPGIGREGPEVIKIADTYYCFYSSWGRGYEVGYSTAKNIHGPWTRYAQNPIYGAQNKAACLHNHKEFTQAADVPYGEVGHGAPFVGPDGRWWISAHFGQTVRPPEAAGYHGWEQPGYDPLKFSEGVFGVTQPTWTAQTVVLPQPVASVKPATRHKKR
jgi:xylan 1,4-beta-xylosidase